MSSSKPKAAGAPAGKNRDVPALIIRILIDAAALITFLIYVFAHKGEYRAYDFIVPFFALLLFARVAAKSAPKLVSLFSGKEEFPHPEKKFSKKTVLFVMLGALVLHVAAVLVGMLIFSKLNPQASFKNVWSLSWMKSNTDAQHYINIAENWYQKDGNDKLLIVFFPMLPIMIRCFNVITQNSYLSGQLINLIATVMSSGMIYLTLRDVLDERRSVIAVFIALLLPGAIFFNSPMTEPLFMLFTVTAFFFMQRKRYILAAVFVALSGFTRSLGVLAAVPLALTGLNELIGLIREKKPWGKRALILVAAGAISVTGTLGYLAINWAIHGDPLKFLEFQWSNWHQKSCPFFDTVRYIFNPYFIGCFSGDVETCFSLWLPQLIMIFGSLIVMIRAARKLPASYTVYFLAYFAVSVGCTWLLSSVRYLSAALPLIAALALFCDRRSRTVQAFAILAAVYVFYTYMYMARWAIY